MLMLSMMMVMLVFSRVCYRLGMLLVCMFCGCMVVGRLVKVGCVIRDSVLIISVVLKEWFLLVSSVRWWCREMKSCLNMRLF